MKSEFQQEKQIRLSVELGPGRPTLSFSWPIGWPLPTETHACQLVDRSLLRLTRRSTGLLLCTLCTPVDRAVGRSLFWPAFRLPSRSFWIPISALFLPMS